MALAHEKLNVYRKSIEFVAWTEGILEAIVKPTSAKNQLERAANSIPLNIAEGNGKFSRKDQCRFLQIAMGSAFECSACLDVLVARKASSDVEVEQGKVYIEEISRMLMGLISSIEKREVREGPGRYGEGPQVED